MNKELVSIAIAVIVVMAVVFSCGVLAGHIVGRDHACAAMSPGSEWVEAIGGCGTREVKAVGK